ncbi:uncharacterized protein LOC115447156 isoform X2 [Manduca sexta]|uniref:uncharacterized protein LOC115447156 isoform X2 n=1 Tax=Manduca sexta TaxID=7130 RepID=UPI00118438E4|nr:uncharacterized protein LOC115447156 isoform X2 [Manduca sexta]
MEHSRLLKFLVPGRSQSTEMAETPSFKVQYEYQNPENVESEVPGSQNIREITEKAHDETTDGAEIQNGGYMITRSYTEQSGTVEGTTITRTTVTLSTNSTSQELVREEKTMVSSEKTEAEDSRPKTKIPKLKFRQAAERVKRERRLTRGLTEHETHIPVPATPTKLSRLSKIPPPTTKPVVHKRDSEDIEVMRPDEEFDKIYEEIIENTQTDIEVKHPEIIESKFEEIIHDYDENKVQPINVEKIRQSRIPSLRRRTSEQAESKTVVVSERTKSRSLPRLKEISMRVKEDEGLGPVKYSRTISTENTGGGQRSVVETRIIKNPDVKTKVSKMITTQTITGGKELNKNIEGSSKTVTVHRTVQVTSQGAASVSIDKNIDQSNMLQTENIMKGSISIGYPTFEAKMTENSNETNKTSTEIRESVKNINTESKNITSEENKMVVQQSQSNVSLTTSKLESNIITQVTTTKSASSYERTTGAKEIVSNKIYTNDNNNTVEITELSPTIERSMTVTSVVSTGNDDGQVKEIEKPKTPTPDKNSRTIITAERNFVEVRSKIPTIERSTTVTRIISSSNDVNVKEIKDFKIEESSTVDEITTQHNLVNTVGTTTKASSSIANEEKITIEEPKSPRKVNGGTFEKVTTESKIVNVLNKTPAIERSTSVTHTTESNNIKTQDIKSPTDDKEENLEKTIARKTIISAISKQVNESRESAREVVMSKKEESIESTAVLKEANVENLTTKENKVGKLIHRIDSTEQTSEIKSKHQVDEFPKKKSILSKIAMFERQDVEDRVPKKKPENLSKLVIKHPPQKVAHLHTPTIVEEVLKIRDDSPLSANSNKDVSPLKPEQVTTLDYNINTEMKQVGEKHSIDIIQGFKDESYYKSKSITDIDYRVKADEYKQRVEMTKVISSLASQDNKNNHVSSSDNKLQETQNVENKTKQDVEIRKDIVISNSNNDVGSVNPDLVATLEYKFDSNINNQSMQNEQETKTNVAKTVTITSNNKEYSAVTPDRPRTIDYQFKGVNRLTSEFERRVEVSKDNKFVSKDIKIHHRPGQIATMDYRFDSVVNTHELNKNIESNEHIAEITRLEKEDIPKTPESVTAIDYKSNVDITVQDIEYEQITDKTEEKSVIVSEEKEENIVTSEAPTIQYTFKDVKKLATEYEQKVESTKNLEVHSRTDTLSPGLLNYESKIFSKSTESLGKVMTDAPVIFVTPKSDLQINTNISKEDDTIQITTQAKEAIAHKAAENSEIQLVKQISREYKEAKIDDNRFIERENAHSSALERSISLTNQNANSNVFKRSTSLTTAATQSRNISSTTINTSKATFTQSSTNVSSGNIEFREARIDGNVIANVQSSNVQILDKTKDSYSETKTVKPRGYVIKREGDLAYARIQEEAEQGDEIRMFEQSPKLPRTPVKETSSTVTRKFKSIEEKKKYYADVDINNVIKGKVSRMISRMTSVDRQEVDKKTIDIKEMPRKMSVLEKIAMFESKAAASKTQYSTVSHTRVEKTKPQAVNMTQEELDERVAELKSARLMFGRIENVPSMLLRNGVEMPVLALGTATLDPRLIQHVIGAAIDLGYRAIDTAYIYGNEKQIGEAIRAKIEDGTVRRDELFIISKLWSTFHRTDLVEKACRSSLDAMGLEYFDLYLIHNPMSFKEGGEAIPKIATVIQYSRFDYLDAWYGMEQLMTKGLVRSIGVSNFNSAQLQRILDKGKIKPTVNQVECHPYLTQQKLDLFCEERDIKLSCFGVLGSKGTPAEYKSTLPPVIDDPLVQVMASGLNVSPAQLLIRYQLDSGRNAVVKSSSAKRLWDNLQALTFTLSQGQVEALHALNRNKRTFTFIGMGDTHKNYPFKIAF